MALNRTLVRRVAIGAGALVALLLVAGAIFTATFDVNRYKPEIAGAVQERTGRTLRFDGDLSLSLFPRIAVRLPATTLSEPKRDTVFARLQSAQASVALMPLLRRELVVDAVRIDGLQATVVRRKDGTTNIDDLLKPAPGATAGKGEPAAAPPPAATIGAVRLEDADLTFNDLAAGRTVRLKDFDLRAGRYAPDARMPLEASGAVTLEPQALAAQVTLAAEIEWGADAAVRSVRDLALRLDGTLAKRPLAVDARAERLVTADDSLDVRGVRITASVPGTADAPLELQLAAPRLEAGQAKAAGERIELVLVRKGAEPFDAKVLVDGIRGTAAKLEATTVKLTGTARSGPRTTRVDLTTALAASVNERTVRFDRASGELVVEDPTFGPKPVRLPITASGAIDGNRETVALQFDARGEGLTARGKINTTGFATPRIGFDIDADQIDADRYFLSAAPKEAAPAKPAAGAAAPAAEEKVDFSALNRLNAAGNVRIGRLRAKGTDVTDVRVALKAGDGRLEAAPFALRVHGGSINGRVGLDSRGNRVAASGGFSGIQLRRLVSDIAGRAAVEGSANGTFQLASAGATVPQMKRAVDGTLALDVRDGALVGIDLADLIGTASGFLQSRGRQTGALDENRRTPFSQLSASVRIRDGVATNDDLKARSPQLDIAGSGRMDLVSTELDYNLRAQVLAGAGAERGALRSLAGLTVPVRITGPAEKPSYSVDWGPIAAEALLKRATGGRTDAPAVNQLIEGLGDLFRRKK